MNKYYKDNYDVVIIGGALAGLSSALTLLEKKLNVLVLEQHNLPGGVATSFVRNGVEFEASLHEMCSIGEIDNPLTVRQFFNKHHIDIDWIRIEDAYRLVTPDIDVVIHAGRNGDLSIPAKDIAEACDDKDGSIYKKLMKFFDLCKEVRKSSIEVSDKTSKLKMITKHSKFVRMIGYTLMDVFKLYDLPQKAIDILSAYWMYLGTPVEHGPFSIFAFIFTEYLGYGPYIPRHTSYEMSAKLAEAVERNGGQIEYNQRVEKILVKDKKVYGVKLASGEIIHTNYVISGAYPNTVYSSMIEPISEVSKEMIKQTNSMELCLSCFSVVMLLDKDYRELGFKDYATFYAPHGMNTVEYFNQGKIHQKWDYLTSVCLNVANEEASPKGTCIYSITYLPNGEAYRNVTAENYEQYKKENIDHFLKMESERLGFNLADHIIELIIETPVTISHYTGAYMGNIYGYRHKMDNHPVSRVMMKNEHFIDGLAFAGAHHFTGDGMGPAISNGINGANDILNEMGKRGMKI